MALVNWIGASGDWSTAADWSTGKVPGANDDVALPGFSYYVVTVSTAISVNSLEIQSYSGNLDIEAPGKTAVVQRDVTNGGYLSIDTSGSGGTTFNVGGTLTNNGTLTIGAQNIGISELSTVTVAHLVNNSWIAINGGEDGFNVKASLIDNGDAAPSTIANGSLTLNGDSLLQFASGKVDSIGENAIVTLNGDMAYIADAGHTNSNSALTALASNAGTFTLADGATVIDSAANFQNSGTFYLNGGSFHTAATTAVSNSGTIVVNSNVSSSGSVLNIAGTLTNTGSLFVADNYEAATNVTVAHLDNSGVLFVEGAQYDSAPPTTFNVTGDAAPATLTGHVSLSVFGDAILTFASGKILSVGADAALALSGAAQINDAGTAGPDSALDQFAENDGSVTLSDGAQLPALAAGFENTGSFSVFAGTSLTARGFNNDGTLNIDSPYYPGSSSSLLVTGSLNNTGILNITGTGDGSSYSTPTRVVVNKLSAIGSINLVGGTLPGQDAMAELIIKNGAAPKILSAGTTVSLSGNALVQYASGFIDTIAHGAKLSLDGLQTRIADSANPTTSSALTMLSRNAGTLQLADGASLGNSAVAFTNSGFYTIAQSTAVSTAAGVNFTNTGMFTLDAAGQQGGSSLAVGGILANTGTITIGSAGGLTNALNLTATSEVIAAHLTNAGTINLFSSEGSASRAFLNDTADTASATLQNQSINLVGNALLEYGSGGIHAIAKGAQITLDGAQASIAVAAKPSFNSALTGLTSNAGTLSLADAATIAKTTASFDNSGSFSLLHQETFNVSGNFQNSGIFVVDRGTQADSNVGQSVVTIDGTLANSGKLLVGDKVYALSGDTTVDVAHLANTGTIDIASTQDSLFDPVQYQAAVVDLKDAASRTLAAGTIELDGNALLEYARGGIAQIAQGATLSLTGAQARIADSADITTSSALTTLVSNAGKLVLSDGAAFSNGTNDFANSGTISIGLASGEVNTGLTIGGTLANTGTIVLSDPNGDVFAAALINAQSVVNEGVILGRGEDVGINTTGTFINTGTIELGADGTSGGGLDVGTLIQKAGRIELHGSALETFPQVGMLPNNVIAVKGGVIEGSGFADSDVTVTGGTFGQTGTGDLSIEGKLTLNSGGTLEATLTADSNFVPLSVNGVLQLNGGTLELHAADSVTFAKGETFVVVRETPGFLHGTFAQIEYDGVVATGNTIAIGNGLALKIQYHNRPTGEINIVVIADPAAHQPASHASAGYTAVAPDGSVVHHLADDLVLHHGAMQHDGLALV